MPFSVPPRRRPQWQPRPVTARSSRNFHPPKDTEEIDAAATAVERALLPIAVVAELTTLGDLVSWAATASSQAPTLLEGTFAQPKSADASYVASAANQDNPARADLDGLAENTWLLKQAASRQFSIAPRSIGGRAYRPYKSDHTTGHAIDIPGSGEHGKQIAEWVVTVASQFKVKYVIHNKMIWYPGRGWLPYNPSAAVTGFSSDALHLRHVHVSTY